MNQHVIGPQRPKTTSTPHKEAEVRHDRKQRHQTHAEKQALPPKLVQAKLALCTGQWRRRVTDVATQIAANGFTATWKAKTSRLISPKSILTVAAQFRTALHLVQRKIPSRLRIAEMKAKKALLTWVPKQAHPVSAATWKKIVRDRRLMPEIRAIVAFAFLGGMRVADVFRIEAQDITVMHRVIRLRIRGAKGANPSAEGYYRWIPKSLVPHELWRLWKSSTLPTLHMSKHRIYNNVRALYPRLSLHSFRRGIATAMARAGTRMEIIQRHLGHQQLSTTRLYVEPHPSQPEVRDITKALKRLHRQL
ncbi:MAG: site-specific integrase [Cyanobacteria bacterium K_DeepCast_35m_m2_023]|nr:site-specific integrase [Cyanobacteria bacterium K_DeepCast_35m_m2_023]